MLLLKLQVNKDIEAHRHALNKINSSPDVIYRKLAVPKDLLVACQPRSVELMFILFIYILPNSKGDLDLKYILEENGVN